MTPRREHRATGLLHGGDDQHEPASPSRLAVPQAWNFEADASFADVA